MKRSPAVSVLTPVYNGGERLGDAIESILGQSHADFDYVIIDDGSEDGSYDVAARYAARDSRITLLRNKTNLGIGRTVNRGIATAQGDVIMVLDQDDFAYPQRLALQSALLAARPDIGIVGCHFEFVDESGVSGFYRPPASSLRLRWELLYRCAIPMTTSCFRRDYLLQAGGFSDSVRIACDYEMLSRLAAVTPMSTVPEVLLSYRCHPAQITRVEAYRTHWEAVVAASTWWHSLLGLNASLIDVSYVYRCVNGERLANQTEAERARILVEDLYRRFLEHEKPSEEDRDYLATNVDAILAALPPAVTL